MVPATLVPLAGDLIETDGAIKSNFQFGNGLVLARTPGIIRNRPMRRARENRALTAPRKRGDVGRRGMRSPFTFEEMIISFFADPGIH
jgi:hypothetical protein